MQNRDEALPSIRSGRPWPVSENAHNSWDVSLLVKECLAGKERSLPIELFIWYVGETFSIKSTVTEFKKLVMVVLRICFDLLLSVHGKQLGQVGTDNCLTGTLFLRKSSRWQLTSIQYPFFGQYLTTCFY